MTLPSDNFFRFGEVNLMIMYRVGQKISKFQRVLRFLLETCLFYFDPTPTLYIQPPQLLAKGVLNSIRQELAMSIFVTSIISKVFLARPLQVSESFY